VGEPALAASDAGANAARARQTASDAAAAARDAERVAASPPDPQGVPAYAAAQINNARPQSPGATGGPAPGAPTPERAALADRAAQGQNQLQQNSLPPDAVAARAPDAPTQNGQLVASGNLPGTSAPLGNPNAQEAAGVSPDQAAAARASAQGAACGDTPPTRTTPPADDAASAPGAAPPAGAFAPRAPGVPCATS